MRLETFKRISVILTEHIQGFSLSRASSKCSKVLDVLPSETTDSLANLDVCANSRHMGEVLGAQRSNMDTLLRHKLQRLHDILLFVSSLLHDLLSVFDVLRIQRSPIDAVFRYATEVLVSSHDIRHVGHDIINVITFRRYWNC